MAKCKICKKEVDFTFDGMCGECLGLKSSRQGKRNMDSENDLSGIQIHEKMGDTDFVEDAQEYKKCGDRLVIRMGKGENVAEQDNIALQLKLNKKERLDYATAIKKVLADYEMDILVLKSKRVCKIEDYGKNGNNGVFVKNIGGLAVYEVANNDKYVMDAETEQMIVNSEEYSSLENMVD